MLVLAFLLLKKLAWVVGGLLVAFLASLPPSPPVKRPPPWWGLFQPKLPPIPDERQWREPERRPIRRGPPFADSPTI